MVVHRPVERSAKRRWTLGCVYREEDWLKNSLFETKTMG